MTALLYIPRYIRDGGFFVSSVLHLIQTVTYVLQFACYQWSFIKMGDDTWYIQNEKDKTYMAPNTNNEVIVLVNEPFLWTVKELPGGFFQ